VPGTGGPSLQVALLAWGAETRRDLPWRRTRDPWAVLVSEAMLQQTQVARVVPRYEAFMETFPTVASCAEAAPGDIVRRWAGLGYNRRALNLHGAATAVVAHHGGKLPATIDALRGLPGVGPYTARAVMTFAFEADVGLVETNSARVLARAVAGHPMSAREAQTVADQMVPIGQGWAWNQAVVDLGATVCVKRCPDCSRCPIAPDCVWARSGRPGPDPAHGTAGASRAQSVFQGSHRQGRGRLIAALRAGPVELPRIPTAAGWPGEPERAHRAAAELVAEGLARRDGERLTLS
jgi:A/G-specific adenine glycosylase